MKIQSDRLVDETSQRLYGLDALVELIYRATPDVELQERNALRQLAEHEGWDDSDYNTEDEFLDVKFRYWLPRLAAYSIIILLSSIVETQLLAFARRVGQREKSPFDPNDLKGSVLDRVRVYLKRVSDVDLAQNEHWQCLKDLQDLRDVIVHRAGKPGDDKRQHVEQMRSLYPGFSLDKNPYTIPNADPELGVTIHSCRYFAKEVEEFFKSVFVHFGFPVRTGLWPNIQTGFH
jgi:hypothetical protein